MGHASFRVFCLYSRTMLESVSKIYLATIMAMYCQPSSALIKTEYVIGGWGAGEWEFTFTNLKPIFETYLTETVGPLYDPPISFKLVPVDQTKESSARQMIKEWKLDFLCEWLGKSICAMNRELCRFFVCVCESTDLSCRP